MNLRLVFLEASLRRAENGQVDIHHDCRIAGRGDLGVARGEDQIPDPAHGLRCSTRLPQDEFRPVRAPHLVVRATGIVDRIVEPEGDGEFTGPSRELARLVEQIQTLSQVLECVVEPVSRGVSG